MPATRRRLQGYGLVRVLRKGWAVPGDPLAAGWMVSGRFGPLHPRATPLQERFPVLVRGRVRGVGATSWLLLGAAAAPVLCRWLLPPPVATASPPRSPSYQAAIGFPGEPVAPTSLSGDQVNRNS